MGARLVTPHTVTGGDYDGWRLRVRAGALEAQTGEPPRWRAIRGLLRDLARAYPVGEGPWPWLLSEGVTRPSTTSGPSGGTPRAKRRRPCIEVTLSPEAIATLDARAESRGESRSACIEALILGAR